MLKIAMINIPFQIEKADGSGLEWITIPPQGYGGIQWVVTNIIDGLLEFGHHIYLLGAPGSPANHPNLTVIDAGKPEDILHWLIHCDVDIIHDHTNSLPLHETPLPCPYVSTHHFTGTPYNPTNAIYLSFAQRAQAARTAEAPIIRIPVNPVRYRFSARKQEYLLMLGRVSAWKGVREAAQFAHAAGKRLKVAGPAWEPDYFQWVQADYGDIIDYEGEVGGEHRLNLLAQAQAILVFSQPVMGPWGTVWSEPGATVVSEASVCGTPVIATDNGCLSEIVPHVGVTVPQGRAVSPTTAKTVLNHLPSATAVQSASIREWGHLHIAKQYVQLYQEVIRGRTWN